MNGFITKTLTLTKVLEYILEEYDMLRQEAEIEDGTDLMA
jgi:hypothetical protein